MVAHRPAPAASRYDECPFPRPFPELFSGCPGYQPAHFVGLDMQLRAVATVWTCSHLEPADRDGRRGGFYARCRLGDARARAAWADKLTAERLAAVRRLQLELGRITEPLSREMWSLKARQVGAGAVDDRDAPETRALHRAGSRFMEVLDRWLRDREPILAAHGFPRTACHRLFAQLIATWISARVLEVPQISSAALAAFPEEVRSLLVPGTSP